MRVARRKGLWLYWKGEMTESVHTPGRPVPRYPVISQMFGVSKRVALGCGHLEASWKRAIVHAAGMQVFSDLD